MKRGQLWILLGLLLVLGIVYTWATWKVFTQAVPGGNDFAAHRSAWQFYFREGTSPYSEEAALYVQETIRGRPALPGEDQNRMIYPFYSILLHGPFAFVDYALARAIYMTLLQVALFAGVLLTLNIVRWRPPLWLFALVLGWSLLYYSQARGIILGQFSIFGFFSLAGTLFLLHRHRDVPAGILLVLSTIKPTLVFLVIPFLLLWALVRRRWRFGLAFAGTLVVLILGSLIILPTWISEWLSQIGLYGGYTIGQSPVWLLTHQALPALGLAGEIALDALLVLGMLWAWWRALRPGGEKEFYWALSITLVVSNLIMPRSATTNYVLMLIPILWGFAILDRGPRWGRATILSVMLISFVGMWWLHFATVVDTQEQPILFIPAPLILGLSLVVGRRWFIRDAEKRRVLL